MTSVSGTLLEISCLLHCCRYRSSISTLGVILCRQPCIVFLFFFFQILTVLPIGLLSADQQTDCVMALLVLDFSLNQRTISDTQEKPWQLLADIRRLEAEFIKEMQRTDKVCQVNLKKVILELTTSHLKLCGKVIVISIELLSYIH